ncbi:MAG: alpha-amylase [Candidatus Lokiarchaeota archaeon]|nr:alpha-amylase [Candidatus Harpocratesius repetitus]
MKVSRFSREKYQIDDSLFSDKGDLYFQGDIHLVRLFTQKINEKRDLINFPEMAAKTSDVYGISLLTEINEYIYQLYLEEIKSPKINQELYDFLEDEIGKENLLKSTKLLIEEFPPQSIYRNEITTDDFLEKLESESGIKNRVKYINEFVNLWLSNINPAFSPYLEFFDDEDLEKQAKYLEIIEKIEKFYDKKPVFKFTGKNIIETLREPINKNPHSLKDQLKYIQEHWSGFLGKWAYLLLISLDLIREEEKIRFLGPGKIQIPDFYGLDKENYSQDSDWMPKVIMIAKNSYVWLDQLSKKYKRSIRHLDQIPDEELDELARWGFTALWLIGIWERSPASKTIKQWCGNNDAVASAYSLYDYTIAQDLGGVEAYKNLKDRALARGIRIASDMVPNHTGIDSKWIREHPDWFIQLDYPPFPSYQYSGHSLSGDPNFGIYLEDKYFTHQDAAVTFKHVDFRSGRTRYIYHGNDGTSMPWNDTAQLNYLLPEVREAVIQNILHVARLSPIIRFDAAMTLTRLHFQRLWYPEPGSGGDIPSRAGLGMTKEEFLKQMPEEFWREVVDRIKKEVPDTLLLAEAFWLLEGFFVRTLGMHRVYNSIFMNALRDEDNALYRSSIKKTLEFDRRILKRFVNFMNNPDEETAIKQFGDGDKYFGICMLLVTMPGLPMFGHGQIEGFREKYGMEFRRAYWDEKVNIGLLQHHKRTIFPIMKKRYLFADSQNFYLYDFWTGGNVNEDVFVYSNMIGSERGLVIFNNRYNETRGYIKKSVGYNENGSIHQKDIIEALEIPSNNYSIVKDYMSGLEFLILNQDLHEKGFYVELHGYQSICFMDWRFQKDNEYFHYAQLYKYLNGKGVPSIQESLQELIYKPILQPYREIYNKSIINRLYSQYNLENPTFNIMDDPISQQINLFSSEIGKFLSSSIDNTKLLAQLEKFLQHLKSELNLFVHFKEELKRISLKSDDWQAIESFLPKNIEEWGLFYAWITLHRLGEIRYNKDFENLSRSWLEEWRLGNVVEWVMGEICEKDSNLSELLYLLKLLIVHQNWFNKGVMDGVSKSYSLLAKIFNDPEIQNYLQFNRYQEILWLNADRFNILCHWLFLISLIPAIYDKNAEIISQNLNLTLTWRDMAQKAKYQVSHLLESLK